jgi:hypothetical protein
MGDRDERGRPCAPIPYKSPFGLLACRSNDPAQMTRLENVIGARAAGMQAVHVQSTDDVRVALHELTRSPSSESGGI